MSASGHTRAKPARSGRGVFGTLLLGLVTALVLVPAHAQVAGDGVRAWLEDPLMVQPPQLRSGTFLPGDAEPLTCLPPLATAPIDLARAVDTALCSNPQIKASWQAIKQQVAALGESKAGYLPTVSLGTSLTNDKTWLPRSDLPGSKIQGSSVYANLTWRLLDGGTREANADLASALLDAALANHDAVLQKIMIDVIQAYFDAQSAQAAQAARRNNETLAGQTLQTASRRESRGAGALGETLQAQTALAKATLDRSRAEGSLRKNQALLAYAMGQPTASDLELAQDFADAGGELRQNLDAWLEEARLSHPAIVAARARLTAASAKVEAVAAEGRPTLDLTSNFYQNGRPTQGLPTTKTRERLIGVNLTVPLFDGFARTYRVSGARAAAEQKEAELASTEQQVLMELIKVHADASSAAQNLEASAKLLDAAQAALASSQRRIDKGAADILELLNAQAALADAQQERVRCLAEWQSARLRLVASAGQAGRQLLH